MEEEPVDLAEEAETGEHIMEEVEQVEKELLETKVSDEEEEDEEFTEDEEDEKKEEEFLEAPERKAVKEEVEEDVVEERFYTIPLSKAWIVPRKKRAPKATRIVRSFVLKHMKLRTNVEEEEEPERLVIDNDVNEKLWSRGIEKPPRKIRVRVVKDKEGVVTVHLAEGD